MAAEFSPFTPVSTFNAAGYLFTLLQILPLVFSQFPSQQTNNSNKLSKLILRAFSRTRTTYGDAKCRANKFVNLLTGTVVKQVMVFRLQNVYWKHTK